MIYNLSETPIVFNSFPDVLMSPSEPYSVGEQPGKGVYACEECGSHVTVREDSDELPSCNICDNDDEVEYIQIS